MLDLPRAMESQDYRRGRRILMHQIAAQARNTGAMPVQEPAELNNQPPDGEQQRLGLVHRRRQFDLTVIAFRHREQRPGIGQLASCSIDLVEQSLPEAASRTIARQCADIAQRLHAHTSKRVKQRLRVDEQPSPARANRLAAPGVGATASVPAKPMASSPESIPSSNLPRPPK